MNGPDRKLHLGCGLNTPEGWVNLDASWSAWFAKHRTFQRVLQKAGLVPRQQAGPRWSPNVVFHDVRKPLPFRAGSFVAVYASHLLEHLYLEQAVRLLKECFRVLKSHGVLRVVVPDLKAAILEYVREKQSSGSDCASVSASAADELCRRLAFRTTAPVGGSLLYRAYSVLTDFHSHKWMYDAESLVWYFRSAGFINVARKALYEREIDDIRAIEQPGRVLDGAGVCAEGVRP